MTSTKAFSQRALSMILCLSPFALIYLVFYYNTKAPIEDLSSLWDRITSSLRGPSTDLSSHRGPSTLQLFKELSPTMNQKYFEETILRALMPKLENNLYPVNVQRFKDSAYYLFKAIHNKTLWNQLDLMNLPSYRFDPDFRNPCWWTGEISTHTCDSFGHGWKNIPRMKKQTGETRVLRCLPYFYLIGQQKCGSTDLFQKISKHPEVASFTSKETYWFYMWRYMDSKCSSIASYIDMFQSCTNIIWQKHKRGALTPYVTGDGSAGFFSHNAFWDLLPGNEGCKEPCVTNANFIHHITPHAKLILLLRNPIDRLYSYYFQRNSGLAVLSAEHFHVLVVRDIEHFRKCQESQPLRTCCYDYKQSGHLLGEIDLVGGIYHVFLADWLNLFPREQLHIIKLEEYARNTKDHLKRLYSFLNLRELSEGELQRIAVGLPANKRGPKGKKVGDMWSSTRALLDTFYKPFNERLATMLNDDKYRW